MDGIKYLAVQHAIAVIIVLTIVTNSQYKSKMLLPDGVRGIYQTKSTVDASVLSKADAINNASKYSSSLCESVAAIQQRCACMLAFATTTLTAAAVLDVNGSVRAV
eukprot:11611-Heterococcus_DN1.PRE.4